MFYCDFSFEHFNDQIQSSGDVLRYDSGIFLFAIVDILCPWFSIMQPFSPFSNTPWTFIVCFSLWLLTLLIGLSKNPLWVLWTLAALSMAWFLFKFFENFFMTYAPLKWVYIRQLSAKEKSRLVQTREIYSAVDIGDLLDLFFSYPFAAGLILNALYYTDNAQFSGISPLDEPATALIKFTVTTGFASNGIGFVVVSPLKALSLSVAFILTSVFLVLLISVFANAASLTASARNPKKKMVRTKPRAANV